MRRQWVDERAKRVSAVAERGVAEAARGSAENERVATERERERLTVELVEARQALDQARDELAVLRGESTACPEVPPSPALSLDTGEQTKKTNQTDPPDQTDPAAESRGDAIGHAPAAIESRNGTAATPAQALAAAVPLPNLDALPARPPIFRYWRDTRLRARLVDLEIEDALHFFSLPIAQRCEARPDEVIRILSLARDDARFELDLAQRLLDHGIENFHFDCLDLRQAIRERRAIESSDEALDGFVEGLVHASALSDLDGYDVVLADGTLRAHITQQAAARSRAAAATTHPLHASALDATLDALARVIRPDGTFALSEALEEATTPLSSRALEVVDRIWQLMPPRYRKESSSGSSGESVEPADMPEIQQMPDEQRDGALTEALLERFHDDAWAAFGHVIDAFIGPQAKAQFDPEIDADRRFIDQVAQLDEARIASGILKPRHLAAWLRPRAR